MRKKVPKMEVWFTTPLFPSALADSIWSPCIKEQSLRVISHLTVPFIREDLFELIPLQSPECSELNFQNYLKKEVHLVNRIDGGTYCK